MKKTIILSIILLFTLPALTQEKAGKKDTTQHLTVYSYRCPTHPNFIADKPGKCPKCGMDLRHLSAKEQMKRNVTKTYVCPADVTVISTQPGKCPKCAKYMQLSPKEKMKAEVVKLYACPMHPDKQSKSPGKCPVCGMDLKETK